MKPVTVGPIPWAPMPLPSFRPMPPACHIAQPDMLTCYAAALTPLASFTPCLPACTPTLACTALQGSIDPRRRDYQAAFAAASHPAVLAQLRRRGEKLLLLGSQRNATLEPPRQLEPFLEVRANVDYEVGRRHGGLGR